MTEKKRIETPFPFNMGADPEFSILLHDKKISAQRIFSTTLGQMKSMNEVHMGYGVSGYGAIGWDGCSETAELRPNPVKKPSDMVTNIHALLESFAADIKLFNLTTLSYKGSVGGHIQFELPEIYATIGEEQGANMLKSKLAGIQRKLVSFYLPILMAEDVINLRIRRRLNYGKLEEYRIDKRQSDDRAAWTLEFRCPSAEWLTSPKITRAIFAYLGTVYHEIMNNPKNVSRCSDILIKNNSQLESLENLAITHFSAVMNMYSQKVKRHIQTFTFYKTHKEDIDFLLNPEAVMAEKKKHDFNIMSGWGFANTKISKRLLCSASNAKKATSMLALDGITDAVNIPFNRDYNIGNFAEQMKIRIIANNWKLKNKYFLFGLRKGISQYIAQDKNRLFVHAPNVKTAQDRYYMDPVFERMSEKFIIRGTNNSYHADTKTQESYIMIGIPYLDRQKNDVKGLISLIYDIENGKNKPVTEFSDSDNDGNGEIRSAYNKTTIGDAVSQDEREDQDQSQRIIDIQSEIANEIATTQDSCPPSNIVRTHDTARSGDYLICDNDPSIFVIIEENETSSHASRRLRMIMNGRNLDSHISHYRLPETETATIPAEMPQVEIDAEDLILTLDKNTVSEASVRL